MKLPTYDPLAGQTATTEDIDRIRCEIESQPIVINDRPWNCTQHDLFRMEAVGAAYPVDDVAWTLSDNTTITLKGMVLLEIRDDLIAELGKRINSLNAVVSDFKSQSVTVRDIQPDQWTETPSET